MRATLALAAMLLVAGCGGSGGHAGAPAPPIRPLDRPAPADALAVLAPPQGKATEGVDLWTSSWNGAGQTCTIEVEPPAPNGSKCDASVRPTAEEIAALLREQKLYRAQVRPDPASPPREIALLPLAAGGASTLIAWRTRDRSLCLLSRQTDGRGGGGGGGPFGPCTGDRTCAAICIQSGGTGSPGDPAEPRYVLAGTVDVHAGAIRVELAGGAATTYPLAGPLVPGSATRRVFMLDLGPRAWRRLELVEHGSVVARRSAPPG